MNVPVAQLDRVLASEAEGYRFESCRERFFITYLLFSRPHAFLAGKFFRLFTLSDLPDK